ncbi:hypothetical protein GHNINEIG_00682 [Hydrogenovibrio crunogenus]|uniref:Uncharacterized protein n=1 Tax=Hydrogenovibrio crunogenus TaxID=39765 RepID=A0A4P7NXY7_9GAMM|nr:hypothetical protein [Hydrogenovibrio crunogenus]QBZ82650.1 hypothetical protein GHNINEIG_00682 [Hydrogenovibrio crunogenus]
MNASNFFVKRYLLPALGMLSVTLLVFFGGNYGLYLHKQELNQSVQVQKQALESVIRQVQFLKDQKRISKIYDKKFTALTNFGTFYKQSRVRWTDELLAIQKQLAFKPFVIQFEPRQPLKQNQLAFMPLKKDIFYFTRLNLTVGMHSDSDIITLFDRISQKISPLFFIESCHLTARPSYVKSPKFRYDVAGMQAQCSLILLEAEPTEFEKVQ